MPSRTIRDLTADVTLDRTDSTDPRSMQVLLKTDRIVFQTDELKRSIALEDVFDIVRDVSRGAAPTTVETVSIAFRSGNAGDVASISARADALVKFQGALYGQVLGDTLCVLEHERGGDADELPTDRFRLSVAASHIRFTAVEGSETTITIQRDRVREFRALPDSGDDRRPAVLLISDAPDGLVKTVVRLPSPRHRNLFGRYLKSEFSLSDLEATDGTDRPDSIDLLLVDDDPQDLHAAEIFLKQRPEPFSIEMASGAQAGLDVIESGTAVDCVVSDYRMPGMDGIEFLRVVRDRHAGLPFILYTGKGSEEVAKRAILDDVTDYVEKDVGTEQYDVLAERIKKAIRDPSGRRR
jgi:CheY-like chemotaxis protein